MESMRSLGGFILLLAGIGLALFVYLPAPVGSIAPSRTAQLSPAKLTPVSRLTYFAFHRLDDTAHLVFAFHRLDDACAARAAFCQP